VKDLGKIILGIAVAIFAIVLGVVIFVPHPSTKGLATKLQRDKLRASIAIKDATEKAKQDEQRVTQATWTGDPEQIPPSALARVSKLAANHGLNLVAFRPQRTNESGEFRQLPFLVTVEGPYPSVTLFCQDIDKPSTKLAVNLIQIASSDAASNAVTASIGLIAYLNVVDPEATNGKI
jgi:Tfp pilus assembly protein PilO